MPESSYPILGKGEKLSGDVDLAGGGFPKPDIRDFDAGRDRLLPQISELYEQVASIPDHNRIDRGVYFCVDLDSSYVAKSYYPRQLVSSADWDLVGSVAWKQDRRDGTFIGAKQSRRLFFRGTTSSISDTYNSILNPDFLTSQVKKEIVRIDSIHTIDTSSFVHVVDEIKDDSLVELIIHSMPPSDWKECLAKLKNIFSFNDYPEFLFNWVRGGAGNGPRFIPAQVSGEMLEQLREFNPLRSLRVMPKISIPRINTDKLINLGPLPQGDGMRAGGVPEVGVFDGGVDHSIPHSSFGVGTAKEDSTGNLLK